MQPARARARVRDEQREKHTTEQRRAENVTRARRDFGESRDRMNLSLVFRSKNVLTRDLRGNQIRSAR